MSTKEPATVSAASVAAPARPGAFHRALFRVNAAGSPVLRPLLTVPAAVLALFAMVTTGAWKPTLLVLGLMLSVLAHEMGHFWRARRHNITVTEVFLGFGPRLWSRRLSSGLEVGLKLIPMGAYVKPVEEEMREASARARVDVALAGPFANLLLAFALMFVAAVGFRHMGPVEAAQLSFKTEQEAVVASLDPIVNLPANTAAMWNGALGGEKPAPEQRILSPVGLGQLADSATTAQDGFWVAIVVLAALNVALGLFNLLPIPPLDGGLVLTSVIEAAASKIMRRKLTVPRMFTNAVSYALVGLVLAAVVAATVLDVTAPVPAIF